MVIELINSLISRINDFFGTIWSGYGGKQIHSEKKMYNIKIKKIKLINH